MNGDEILKEASKLNVPPCLFTADIPLSMNEKGEPLSDKTTKDAYLREDEPDELGCYCMMRHFNSLRRQSIYGRTADFGEACEGCEKYLNDECHLEWEWNIMPIAKKAGLGPTFSPPKYED